MVNKEVKEFIGSIMGILDIAEEENWSITDIKEYIISYFEQC